MLKPHIGISNERQRQNLKAYENFGIAVAKAMIHGTPVVSSDQKQLKRSPTAVSTSAQSSTLALAETRYNSRVD